SGSLGVMKPREILRVGIVRQIPVAQLLDLLVDDASLEDVLADVAPAGEGVRHQSADLVGGRPEPRHGDSNRARARPAPGSPGSSPWPTPQVLMTRCWPYVSARNDPSSTIAGAPRCSRSIAQSRAPAPSGAHTRMVVHTSAALCPAVERSERAQLSRA